VNTEAARLSAGEGVNTAPGLTLTGLYNVLAALRAGRALTAKEKTIHTQGLVGVLRELHDELDAAVLAAYGLPPHASPDAILAHLVQLNTQRAQQEAQGHIRWLRPRLPKSAKNAIKTKSCHRLLHKRKTLIFMMKNHYQNKSNRRQPPGPPPCPSRCAPWLTCWPPALRPCPWRR